MSSQSEISTVEHLRRQIRAQVINTPETADFMAAVPLEAAHQRERWSGEDPHKGPANWLSLLAFLGGKAVMAFARGDQEKGLHHVITVAAACANWHAQATGKYAHPGAAGPTL